MWRAARPVLVCPPRHYSTHSPIELAQRPSMPRKDSPASALKSHLSRVHSTTSNSASATLLPASTQAKTLIEAIVSGAGGDISSVVMSLEWACRRMSFDPPSAGLARGKRKGWVSSSLRLWVKRWLTCFVIFGGVVGRREGWTRQWWRR